MACRFYARGYCNRGTNCTFAHCDGDTICSQSPSRHVQTTPGPSNDKDVCIPTTQSPCRFFQLGTCKNGVSCKFEHIKPASALATSWREFQPSRPTAAEHIVAKSHVGRDSHLRDIGGMSVSFGNGACIMAVEPLGNFTILEFAGPFLRAPAMVLQQLLLHSNILHTDVISLQPEQREVNQHTFQVKVKNRHSVSRIVQAAKDTGVNVRLKPSTVNTPSSTARNLIRAPYLRCSWYHPSKVAYLHFNHSEPAEAAADLLRNKTIRDRKISVTYNRPPHFNKGIILSVGLGNLHTSTTESDITLALRRCRKPVKIVFGEVSHALTPQQVQDHIRGLFEGFGALEGWEPSPEDSSSKAKALVRYERKEDVYKACKSLHDTKIPLLGNMKIMVNLVISVKVVILHSLYTVVEHDILQLQAHFWATDQVRLNIYAPATPLCLVTTLHIHGEDSRKVVKTKVALEKLLAGSAASDLWHVCFDDDTALIQSINQRIGGFIFLDSHKRTLRLFGTDAQKSAQRAMLQQSITDYEAQERVFALTKLQLVQAMQGGLNRLSKLYSKENVSFNVTTRPATIAVRNHAVTSDAVYGTLSTTESQHEDNNESHESDCCICWSTAEDGIILDCKHIYCRDCFTGQCTSFTTSGSSNDGIHCYGNADTCRRSISIPELERHLPADIFDLVLSRAFENFVTARTEEYQACPTPDCTHIHTIGQPSSAEEAEGESEVIMCGGCLESICLACQTTSHMGMTCAEYRDLKDEGTEAFMAWKKEHDVRDCPSCKVGIEKSFGCQHMECGACHIHICWFCMRTFEKGGDTYKHMAKEHGNFGI